MSRLKRFLTGTIAATLVLCCLTGLWYRRHYMLPPEPPHSVVLPSPNGFEAIQEATALRVVQIDRVTLLSALQQQSTTWQQRKALVDANQKALIRLRVGLRQNYLQPTHIPPQALSDYYSACYHLALALNLKARLQADAGNLSEALACALDAIELGITIPRGGGLQARSYGAACERLGKETIWELADHLNAATARAAAMRLRRLDDSRWPLAATLDEERRITQHSLRVLFTEGPVVTWKTMNQKYLADSAQAELQRTKIYRSDAAENSVLRKLWNQHYLQTQLIYQGPRTALKESDRWFALQIEKANAPWSPNQRQESSTPLSYKLLSDSAPTLTECKALDTRNRVPFLQAYLALRAEYLETGRYPKSPALPLDPYSPQKATIKYRHLGNAFTLWSVGADGVDDDGMFLEGRPDSPLGCIRGDLLPRKNSW